MAQYFFHARTTAGALIVDEVGTTFEEDWQAEREALEAILDLTRNDADQWHGAAFEVFRGEEHVVTLAFDDVLSYGGRLTRPRRKN